MQVVQADVAIIGGGTGGCAAAMALQSWGLSVVMTDPTDWIGGQLTSQIVPADEHPWIETCGCTKSYRDYRNRVRQWYRDHRLLTTAARRNQRLNPGRGWVSHLCHEPAVGWQVLNNMLDESLTSGRLTLLLETEPVAAEVIGDQVIAVQVRSDDGTETRIEAKFFLDATELGDLLPMTGTEYVVGAESKAETGEPNALDGPAEPDNVQGITWCAALSYDPNADHTIDRPANYEFWRDLEPPNWCGKLLSFQMLDVRSGQAREFPLFGDTWWNMFSYRQIVDHSIYEEPNLHPDATCMNWPMNDYFEATTLDVPAETLQERFQAARELTLSYIYWLQTDRGYPGLYLRPDLTGTEDGLAKHPYIRESRRIRALHTICEQHVAAYTNEGCRVAPPVPDSVGIGAYRIDLHPAANGRPTIDTSSLPFQIPLRSLVPVRMRNLLPACKNLGVTHITNGCYRLHPVEWNIGEAAGQLAAWCLAHGLTPMQVADDAGHVRAFQDHLLNSGFELAWPEFGPL